MSNCNVLLYELNPTTTMNDECHWYKVKMNDGRSPRIWREKERERDGSRGSSTNRYLHIVFHDYRSN